IQFGPESAVMKALDFKANRATALNKKLSRYRITGRRSRCKANGDEFERQIGAPSDHNKKRKDQDYETRCPNNFAGDGYAAQPRAAQTVAAGFDHSRSAAGPAGRGRAQPSQRAGAVWIAARGCDGGALRLLSGAEEGRRLDGR